MTGSRIRTQLTILIDNLIIENHPEALDDDQVELLQDGDEREEAINQLIKMIEFYREDL